MTTTVETFASFDPATGKELARYPIHDAGQVRAAVDRARVGGTWWAGLAPAERRRRMRAWAAELVRTRHTLAALIHDETGKPHDDAFLELLLGLEHIAWASAHAARVLRRRRLPSGLAMANHAAYVEYRPFGVVGVIGPWNYPVFTPLGSIAYALAAGNTVLFKPSEHTSGVGVFLADAFARANPDAMAGVFEVVTGGGSTGAALCGAGVDKLAFTGSGATGTRVMTACARTLTPVLMECGGKDAVIAFASIPALPFGGVGASGFGRIHGADGLREFARPQSITRRLFRTPIEPTSFARTRGTMKLLDRYVALRFGRRA
ncbi:aldehyde dehydrogenase family protein [Embleya sp. NPDC005971]|uniref:aldehyde dehydrogenase family protein n=1 Tax=unclassified Embleya TaxID=2699296 RepID=UPI0033C43153